MVDTLMQVGVVMGVSMSALEAAHTSSARFDRFVSRRFGVVVLQPTTLCPWACDYCYLPSKDQRLEMLPSTAAAVAASIEAQGGPDVVEVVWHGGEPLTAGVERFRALLEPFEPLRARGRVRYTVQTGGGLITQPWCDLFARYGFTVGVSIDGPEWANAARHDRSGRPAHARIMRGIRTLLDCGVRFTAIAVVTGDTITRPDEIADFFETLGADSVGFNLEEYEGANTNRPPIDAAAARTFWRALLKRRLDGSPLRVRELYRLLGFVRQSRGPSSARSGPALYEPIPTVAWNGDTVILSPELAGVRSKEYGDFVIGNVLRETLPAMLARADKARYVDEFTQALTACAESCEFYAFCLGAQAGNRYFEHGDFSAPETQYCTNTRQELVRALGELIEEAP
ncbi:radical SAM protein [Actinocrinis puniceicyclus]|uniref:Radical SAM protein n=1 Tax=Actinocrinis puniceicyclus TaxID=977794 RepID=A0A8J8BG58_9ACTN|nr:cyclophane-forming radical SAM peptide maturase AmcB [Actinocrinis puniceicyclus]MBS2966801.1 radical SAM protein [Actinocrinis puniceicyclus]